MAHAAASVHSSTDIKEAEELLWGPSVREEVFHRWCQGFQFSEEEPTALVQREGGPCAVLAPVQSFVLKHVIAKENDRNNWKNVSVDDCNTLLIQALCDILQQLRPVMLEKQQGLFTIVLMTNTVNDETGNDISTHTGQPSYKDFQQMLTPKHLVSMEEVEHTVRENLELFTGPFGVLTFLYSVIYTKGVNQIRNEMEDPSEALIESTHGQGCQSLINLMLTGRAVSHVFDNEKDVDGLQLHGVSENCEIGFLTLLEHLRYCEVGSYLKNPKNPIWLLGSETHLTVLFSKEQQLVSPESPSDTAQRVFKSFDADGNNFISTDLLTNVLKVLGLVTEKGYVDLMKKKLDSEGLGIILLRDFMDEFFPNQKRNVPDTFCLFHYNGLPHSSPGNKVVYQEGQAVLLESDVTSMAANNPMQTCLQTKWPNIEVQWLGDSVPSLN